MIDTFLPAFGAVLIKIIPLYLVMVLGFIYGRSHRGAAEPLSFLQIYFVAPVVLGSNIASMSFRGAYLFLPAITYVIACTVGLVSYRFYKWIWKDNTGNIFSYACANGNSGYFGVPVALILFPSEKLGIFMLASVGFILMENTLGYYLIARGQFSARESLRKLARLPNVYAIAFGVVLSAIHFAPPAFAGDVLRDFRGTYVVLGALMVGLGISRLEKLTIEGKLIATVFAFKFLAWPALALVAVVLDESVFHLFDADIHRMLLLLAIIPLPANAIPFAIQLKVQPDKASTLVFVSTVFALFYVPFVMALWDS